MTIDDIATDRWAKDETNPKIGFWCVLFISKFNSANIFANGCNYENKEDKEDKEDFLLIWT